MKRTALVGAKIAVSLALLAYLLSTTDLRRARASACARPTSLDLLAAVALLRR